jgi:hypothetical protein
MYKKISCLIVTLAVVLFMGIPVVDAADGNIYVDGQVLAGAEPILIAGKTMVPMRIIFEKMGASINWDSPTQTVVARKDGKTIHLPVGSTEVTIDGVGTDIGIAPQILNGKVYVPLRFSATAFSGSVEYDSATKKISISTSKKDLTGSSTFNTQENLSSQASVSTGLTEKTGLANLIFAVNGSPLSIAPPAEKNGNYGPFNAKVGDTVTITLVTGDGVKVEEVSFVAAAPATFDIDLKQVYAGHNSVSMSSLFQKVRNSNAYSGIWDKYTSKNWSDLNATGALKSKPLINEIVPGPWFTVKFSEQPKGPIMQPVPVVVPVNTYEPPVYQLPTVDNSAVIASLQALIRMADNSIAFQQKMLDGYLKDLKDAQIKLENAKTNKTVQELVRNSRGEWDFRYTVDIEEVNKAQQWVDYYSNKVKDCRDEIARSEAEKADYVARLSQLR